MIQTDITNTTVTQRTISASLLRNNFYLKSETDTLLNGKAASSHTHPISQVTDLQSTLNSKLDKNPNIAASTKTKITYDAKGLVTGGADLTASDIPEIPISKTTGLETELDNLSEALDNTVKLTGDQLIEGRKTFTDLVVGVDSEESDL